MTKTVWETYWAIRTTRGYFSYAYSTEEAAKKDIPVVEALGYKVIGVFLRKEAVHIMQAARKHSKKSA